MVFFLGASQHQLATTAPTTLQNLEQPQHQSNLSAMIEDMVPPPGQARLVPQKSSRRSSQSTKKQSVYLDDEAVPELHKSSSDTKKSTGKQWSDNVVWQKVKNTLG